MIQGYYNLINSLLLIQHPILIPLELICKIISFISLFEFSDKTAKLSDHVINTL